MTTCHFNNLLSFHTAISANSGQLQLLQGSSHSASSIRSRRWTGLGCQLELPEQQWPAAGEMIPILAPTLKHF